MKNIFSTLKEARLRKGLKLREVAAQTGIDAALLSKMEQGRRLPTERQLESLATFYGLEQQQLRTLWLSEKVLGLLAEEPQALEVLQVAESRLEYLVSARRFDLPALPDELEEKLRRLDELKERWAAAKPLNPTQMQRLRAFFDIEYTWQSNRIEGNTLTLQETKLVVEEGLTIGGKKMVEHLEAINHAEAVGFIFALADGGEDLNRRNLLQLHALILKGIDPENAGKWRSVPVRISGSRHVPPQPWQLEQLMEDYLRHYQRRKTVLHPVLLAAEMHERLVRIHPFIDGNGRTARLVMNFILLRNGYTIAILKGDPTRRLEYYRALEKVQVDNDPLPFYLLVADEVEESLQRHLELV